ncbi:pyrimidine reductase family protein [Ornithinimicrobium humiphilum]|uniref:Riboflavin biosynthesis pyrimidine reductase n=1 Tax=Ornithinimicrobium humiphilum TaxID=125288 RepID=A0A543KNG7_9MICO|nr:dihydrofolate reductase family protein [Ornithinimicrobium humiphilum]TQM96625.1 riboflavin biosynthesis pyrimidine reductase [Ornithinimicrobium humiphilum]
MDVRTATGPLDADRLAEWYAVPPEARDRTWVRGSFITSLDGRATGPGGLSGGLNAGSEGDHAAFHHVREQADVVVVGAGTIRSEGYGPLPRVNLAVVTRSGDVPDKVLDRSPGDGEVVVISGDGAEVTPRQVLDEVGRRGWRSVVIEGGPSLFAPWVRAGLVDELCVTVRPVLVGGDGPLLVPASARFDDLVGRATHVLVWGGDVLVRTRLR